MFGPIYELAIVKHTPEKMLGMIVQVYTSDNKLYLYEIDEVRLHAALDPRRRDQRRQRAAVAPDLGGAEGHARQDPADREAVSVDGGGPGATRTPRPDPVNCG